MTTWNYGQGPQDEELRKKRMNIIFAVKQRNDGKINSHKWFFHGVCNYLNPQYCLMLDIGTRPDQQAIYKLYNYMEMNPNCGGCCGEIEADMKGPGSYMLKAAQFFEYKIGHALDKAAESIFGFISVLPGAYSLFRWSAI